MTVFRMTMIAAATAAASPALAQQTTVQQDFEAATALGSKGDNQAALVAWEQLEARVAGRPRNLAIVRVRKSAVLFALDRKEEAVEAARAGLADLPADDPTLREDRYSAYERLGRIAEASLDYASATDAYREAAALAPSLTTKAAALRGLIATDMFVAPERVGPELAEADAALANVQVDAKVRATFDQLRSEWRLNTGDFAGARDAAARAVRALGGLTTQTDLYDVAARSDYAIAALLGGNADAAREYMAYTGAGRLPKGSFDPGVQMKVPDCGGEARLKPRDVAVIQFSISDAGTVIDSTPIYASGGGEAALAFARAARDWSWTPEQVKQLPAFFRYRARVELRCSTAFERPSIGEYLDGVLGGWLAARGVTMPPLATGSDAAALPLQRTALADVEANGGAAGLAAVPAFDALIGNSVVGREETYALAMRAAAILAANNAPPLARLAIARHIWQSSSPDAWLPKKYDRIVAPALADPEYADDPASRAAVRMLLADAIRRANEDRAELLVRQVTEDAALPATDPLKVAALVRLASFKAADGDVAAARAAFNRSGLDPRQCSLVDSPPQVVATHAKSRDFPMEAQRWGFEGWTQLQFDVGADGHVINERAVVSYPPFVFTEAGEGVMAGVEYEKTYRPDGGLGCGGISQRVRFTLG